MRLFFRLLPVALLLFIGGALLFGQSLPSEMTLRRSLLIEASPAEVFERVGRIRGWQGWYVPPEAGIFEGPEGTGGALVVEDEETGEPHRIVLTETSSPTLVRYAFPKRDQDPFEIDGSFELKAVPEGTEVTSSQQLVAKDGGFMRNAGSRWFLKLLADNLIGSILERELHNLKSVLEDLPPPGTPREGGDAQ